MPLLLKAHGVGWELKIVGKLPSLPPFIEVSPQSSIVTKGEVNLQTRDPFTEKLIPTASGLLIEPLFYEAVDYDIYFKNGADVVIKLPPGADRGLIEPGNEHYKINFRNNVGFVDIRLETPSGHSCIRLEVFARKVDYKTDYVAMRDEVSGMLANLAMTANAKTYSLAASNTNSRPTLVEWFAVVKQYFDDFIKLTNAVAKKPHSGLVRKLILTKTERARKLSRQTISRALRRENGGAFVPSLGIALPRKINEEISTVTFDTPVNRYYKGLLQAIYRNIRALSSVTETGDEDADRYSERRFFSAIQGDLKIMQRRLETVMKSPFLMSVGEPTLKRPSSMVLHKHPVYSRVDKMARIFNSGLSFTGELVPIGVKDTALLYEYWCFLKIIELLQENFDLEEQTVVQVKNLRTTVALAKGKSSTIRFIHRPTNKQLRVIYNRMFDRLPTIGQKPDNVIQLASDTKLYIFDAKYRVQFDKNYRDKYYGTGPTTEDINTMHRYRDAIVIAHPEDSSNYFKGIVQGAVVLFPFPNEQSYQSHWFYESIAKVEIGGLPFLPNATSLVAQKLSALLSANLIDAPDQ